jgi:RHS repeat-associated protein
VSYTRGADLSGSFHGAGGIGGLLARSSGYSSSTGNWSTHYFYHADGNGNITYLVDSSQNLAASYRYDPFGNTVSSTGTIASANVYRFSSKEIHASSGMYCYLHRLYDPNLQRWISRDPIEDQPGRATRKKIRAQAQAGWNLYQFNSGDAINNADPNGKISISHLISEASRWVGYGGSCCNWGRNSEWWLDNGVWKQLPAGQCTGFTDDCDGMTCQGQFYAVRASGNAECNPNATCISRGPSVLPYGQIGLIQSPGWSPGDGLHTSPYRRGAQELPPDYPWLM